MQSETIAEGPAVLVAAFAIALGGCALGLMSLHAAAENPEGKHRGWFFLAVFGIGISAICGSQFIGVVSISYFGNNGLIGSAAFLGELPVALVAAITALAAVRAGRGGVAGAVSGGVVIGAGSVLAHVLLLTGMVNPTFDSNVGRLFASAGIAAVLATIALRLHAAKNRVGRVFSPLLLAVAIVAAERIDMSALTVNANAPALTESTPVALTGIPCENLIGPLLAIAAISAIALFFVAMQGTAASNDAEKSVANAL